MPNILTPVAESTFRAGDSILIQGSASDLDDGILPQSAFLWTVVFHHEGHVHPAVTVPGTNQFVFEVPSSGHDFEGYTRYRIILTVTDSDGLSATDSFYIFPEKVDLEFDTIPSGLTMSLNGIERTTPFTRDALIGFEHVLNAPNQSQSGTDYLFDSWSDQGTQQHGIVVPANNTNFVATFNVAPDTTPPDLVQVTALDSTTVEVQFSEAVEELSAREASNYALDGSGGVTWALPDSDPSRVILITRPLTEGTHTLTVNNIRDIASPPNTITTNTETTFNFAFEAARHEAGLMALYGFSEGQGDTVYDVSGSTVPLDLTVVDPSRVQWIGGNSNGLSFVSSGAAARSAAAATSLHAALSVSNQLTLEAWMTPANLVQGGPARIVTYSGGILGGDQNTHLGQEGAGATFRLRTSTTPFTQLLAGNTFLNTSSPRHVVATYDGAVKRLYVDGVQHPSTESVNGDLSAWTDTYPLVLGNESTLDRSWLGTLHLVAIYRQALSTSEVAQNYDAGHTLPPPDVDPPAILAIEVADSTTLQILFSEPLDPISVAAVTNYSLSGGVTINAATLEEDTRTVTLTTSPLPYGIHTLTVNNIRDTAIPGNPVIPDSQALISYPDPAPALVILSVDLFQSTNIRITWTAATNQIYGVRFRPDLNTAWSSLATNLVATNQTTQFVDDTGLSTQRFYQIFIPGP